MKICPRCQQANDDSAASCTACGVSLGAAPHGPAPRGDEPAGAPPGPGPDLGPDSVEVPVAELHAQNVVAGPPRLPPHTGQAPPGVGPRAAGHAAPDARLQRASADVRDWQRASALAPRPAPATGTALLAGVVGLGVAAAVGMVGALISPVLGSIAGLAAWVGVLFLVAYARDRENPMATDNMGSAFLLLVAAHGIAAVVAGGVGVVWVLYRLTHGSCPHVYAYDGETYRLDADPLSGAFLRGAERDDLVRLEHARAVNGRYRLEIRDELPEKDAIDALSLVVVDHDPAVEVLPTQDGTLLGLSGSVLPTAARDGSGADRLASVSAPDDGAFVAADADPAAETATLELSFVPPQLDSAPSRALALALRAHATPFAEEAFARYVGAMGPGLGPLMEWAHDDGAHGFRDRIHEEIRRLGLPLTVEVDAGEGFHPVAELGPEGPAVQRTQAVLLPASAVFPGHEGGDPWSSRPAGPVRVRLRWTPRFWAIDAARLGAANRLTPVATLAPSVASGPRGSVLEQLRAADGQRVVLSEGERVALELEAPPGPAEGRARTTLLHIRGYYEMDQGPGRWVNPGVVLAHETGTDSLPRFAARLARHRPDLVEAGVR